MILQRMQWTRLCLALGLVQGACTDQVTSPTPDSGTEQPAPDDDSGGATSSGGGEMDSGAGSSTETPADAAPSTGGDAGSESCRLDGDGDGTTDCDDGCPTNPDKTSPGECGCEVAVGECTEDPGPDESDGGGDGNGGEPHSNLQVLIDGAWRGVCCAGSRLEISDGACTWREGGRVLTDTREDEELDCPEGGPVTCECNSSGERMHGAPGGPVDTSLRLTDGAPIFPNIGRETCVFVDDDGQLKTRNSSVTGNKWDDASGWPDKDCPHFRLVDFY